MMKLREILDNVSPFDSYNKAPDFDMITVNSKTYYYQDSAFVVCIGSFGSKIEFKYGLRPTKCRNPKKKYSIGYFAYDSDMNRLVHYLPIQDGERHMYSGISRLINDEAYFFQQSLIQDFPFTREDLIDLVQYHEHVKYMSGFCNAS